MDWLLLHPVLEGRLVSKAVAVHILDQLVDHEFDRLDRVTGLLCENLGNVGSVSGGRLDGIVPQFPDRQPDPDGGCKHHGHNDGSHAGIGRR